MNLFNSVFPCKNLDKVSRYVSDSQFWSKYCNKHIMGKYSYYSWKLKKLFCCEKFLDYHGMSPGCRYASASLTVLYFSINQMIISISCLCLYKYQEIIT